MNDWLNAAAQADRVSHERNSDVSTHAMPRHPLPDDRGTSRCVDMRSLSAATLRARTMGPNLKAWLTDEGYGAFRNFHLARGCEHGYDVDDWRQAEQELKDASRFTVRR